MSLFKANPINDETLADVVPNGVPKPEDKVTPHAGADGSEHVQPGSLRDPDPSIAAVTGADISDSNIPEMLTCDNATHFKAPNGRVFPATDVLRRMSKSDGKLQPCDAPPKPPVADE